MAASHSSDAGASTQMEQKHVGSVDPCTGETVARFEVTEPGAIPGVLAHARAAQTEWARRSIRERCAAVRRLSDALFESREEIVGVITRETGKPRVEAIFAELVLALDTADYFIRHAATWLRRERVPHRT